VVSDRAQARAEIYDLLNTAWLADVASQDVPLLWENKRPPASVELSEAGEPVNAPSWARASIRHNTDASGGQEASAGGDSSGSGTRVYDREGVVIVQIFTTPGKGLHLADDLGTIAERAFQGKETVPGAVWFRNVRTFDVGRSGDWHQTNVVAEFSYQEQR
jgi:hypothetical protein